MSSPEQIAANRKNSLKSTGPKTTLGKSRSSKNALRHGVFGEGATAIPRGPFAENPDVLEKAIEDLAQSLHPRDAIEWQQARMVAGSYNQLRRLDELEAHALAADTIAHPHQAQLDRNGDALELLGSRASDVYDMLSDLDGCSEDPEDDDWDMLASFLVSTRPTGQPQWVKDLWTTDRVPETQADWKRATLALAAAYYGDIPAAAQWARRYSFEKLDESWVATTELLENAAQRALNRTLTKTLDHRTRLGRQLQQQLNIFRQLADRDLAAGARDEPGDHTVDGDGQEGDRD